MSSFPPFRLRVDDKALRIDFKSLPPEVQTHLTVNVSYNPATHDVYQFTIIPEFTFDRNADDVSKVPRRVKKQSWSVVDRLTVQIRVLTDAVELLGAFPKTMHATEAGWRIDDIEATFKARLFNVITFGLVGRAKNYARSKTPVVLMWHSPKEAQWAFEGPYIKADPNFQMKILCAVPRNTSVKHHIAVCDAVATDGKRLVDGSFRKMISLPA